MTTINKIYLFYIYNEIWRAQFTPFSWSLPSHNDNYRAKLMFRYCLQVFNSRPNLTRHLTAVHGYRPPSPRKLKPRSPFYIRSTPLTRLARRLCQDLYNKVDHCRVPGGTLNIQEIRSQCKSFILLSFLYKSKTNFTITAEIHAHSLAKFYGQYADRHMNL